MMIFGGCTRNTPPARREPSPGSSSPAVLSCHRPAEGAPMQFGFLVMADINEIGFFNHVETLGYHSAWVADSQTLYSDCYSVLALAARQTTRLRLGPGTAI